MDVESILDDDENGGKRMYRTIYKRDPSILPLILLARKSVFVQVKIDSIEMKIFNFHFSVLFSI